MGFFDFLFSRSIINAAKKASQDNSANSSYRNTSGYDRGYEDGYDDSCVDNHCDYCDGPEEYYENYGECDDGECNW